MGLIAENLKKHAENLRFCILGCLWEPFGIAHVSFFIDFGSLLAHQAASFAILGPFWRSLWPRTPGTSRESAEKRRESAENRRKRAENPPYEHWAKTLLPLRRLRRYFVRPQAIDEKA